MKINDADKPSRLPVIVSGSLIVILVGCYLLFPEFKSGVQDAFEILTSDDEARVREWVSHFGMWGPVVIVLTMMVQMFLFIVPNVLLMLIAIICYGPVWGAVIAFIGVFASSSLGYWIGCNLSPVLLKKLVSAKTQEKIGAFIKDYGVGAIMITRVSSFSNDALGFVAGILKMGYKRYILSTLAGITPLIVMLAIFGHNGRIERALIWIAAISLVLLVIYIVFDKRRKKKRALAAASAVSTPERKSIRPAQERLKQNPAPEKA
ncbi:MAG TPA: VTT domain-containing protein [Ohtaekwangia sp.]|nr:VTT domain-containing protein [Ohtaekwangia sp.]